MHTYTYNEFRIHYNGDYSGFARVVNTVTGEETQVPCTLLLGFAAEYVRSKRISQLEDMDFEEILS